MLAVREGVSKAYRIKNRLGKAWGSQGKWRASGQAGGVAEQVGFISNKLDVSVDYLCTLSTWLRMRVWERQYMSIGGIPVTRSLLKCS